jgi:hypothetical protein
MKPARCCLHRDTHLIEWLYEDGIGEERAILVDNGQIVEARIRRQGAIVAGLIAEAQLIKILVAGKRGIARLASGAELLLSPLPAGFTEGATLTIEATRAAIDEKTRFKLPLARSANDKAPRAAPTLLEEIGAATMCYPHEKDRFAAYGWHEVMEEASSGQIAFPGGSLIISVTPAMTVIDVDGDGPALPLSIAAAQAAARAIRRLDVQGSIGIDFPGGADKAGRQAIAEALDAAMTGPFERTAVNGFGLLQIIKRRTGPSLPEIMQHDRITGYTLELLRMAERSHGTGMMTLVGHPAVIAKLDGQQGWLDLLSKRTGRAVSLRSDSKLSIGGYYAE